jgi:acyl-CoA reductase-like NAD-dependent aldehyde dehydrogenase
MTVDTLSSHNPWTSELVAALPSTSLAVVNDEINAVARAFPAWSEEQQTRHAALMELSQAITAQRETIIALLINEAGKNKTDAEAEFELLGKKITLSLSACAERTPQVVNATTEPQRYWKARGVAAVFGPFNFPLHLLHGLVVPALAVGCTVIAKPSERCPRLGQLYAQLIAQTSLKNACRIVHGGHAVAQTILQHPAISTVAAVGSYRMGQALCQALSTRPEIITALELGGVNPALILPDADIPAASTAIADGAWRMAGQRCTATRVVHVPRALCRAFINALEIARQSWLPDGMPTGKNGALISLAARQDFICAVNNRPAELSLIAGDPNKSFAASSCVDPIALLVEDPAVRQHTAYRDEHFGPRLIIDPYDDLDDALTRMSDNPYRLAAAIYTADRARFVSLAKKLPYGQVNHNRPTAGARSDMPFGGLGKSGNGRPAAIAAGALFADECVIW